MSADCAASADATPAPVGIVHAYYRQLGGEDISTGLERDLLTDDGIPVAFASVRNADMAISDRVQIMMSGGYHRGLAQRVLNQIECRSPVLVHVQNVWPSITPAIHELLSERGIASIQHLRNFRLTCLNGKHFRKGRVCLDCLGRSPVVTGMRRRCHDGELLRSGLSAAIWWQTRRRRIYSEHVTSCIAMSRFGIGMAQEAEIPRERIYCKPDFVADPGVGPPPSESRDIGFVGRLSPEKGVEVVLRAWAQLDTSTARLVLIGDGPLRQALEALTEELGIASSVVFTGARSPAETLAAVKRCRCLVQPACWFETFGRTVVEAYATGRPVIASRIGALEELTEIFPAELRPEAGNEGAWAAAMEWILGVGSQVDELGQLARDDYLSCFTPESNRDLMLGIYADTLERSGRSVPGYMNGVRRAVPGMHYRQYFDSDSDPESEPSGEPILPSGVGERVME
jgi:glycosyltransferase involved in cell wall biosynthesis